MSAVWRSAGGAALVLSVLALLVVLDPGQVRAVAAVLMMIALAQSWNVLGGFAGYISFGQVAFFGIGGYTAAVAMTWGGISFWFAMPMGGLIAAAFAALIGMPLLRLKGHYFAIATLGVAEGMREVVINLPALTGGGAGISIPVVGGDPVTAYLGNDGFYVLFLGLAVAATAVVALLGGSRLGYALRAIREDEDAAAASAVNTTRVKVTALALSALLAGLVGAAFAFQQVAIYPQRLFDVEISLLVVVMVVIGGSGTVFGPVLGAVGMQMLAEFLRAYFAGVHLVALGLIVVAVVVLMPQGLVFFIKDVRRTGRLDLLENVRSYRL